jgi:hypothetical protein
MNDDAVNSEARLGEGRGKMPFAIFKLQCFLQCAVKKAWRVSA